MIYVGTSGWVYKDWRGRFYPEQLAQRAWLGHYAERFATVELNNSFYRLPSREAFAAWRETVPEGFVFAVKASRFITHLKRLRDGGPPNELFWSRVEALRPRLGPLLYQMPPRFPVDVPRLEAFLPTVPRGVPAAFEFRDPRWRSDRVLALLDDAGMAWVLADRPGGRVEPVVTGGWSYIRFHQGRRTAPGYTRVKLARWADRIAALPARDVYAYFNNDQRAAAIGDAVRLIELLGERGARVTRRAASPRR